MSTTEDIEVEELFEEVQDAERELLELLESPEENADAIRGEVDALFDLTETVLRNYAGLVDRIDALREAIEADVAAAERTRKRGEDSTERLGYDDEE